MSRFEYIMWKLWLEMPKAWLWKTTWHQSTWIVSVLLKESLKKKNPSPQLRRRETTTLWAPELLESADGAVCGPGANSWHSPPVWVTHGFISHYTISLFLPSPRREELISHDFLPSLKQKSFRRPPRPCALANQLPAGAHLLQVHLVRILPPPRRLGSRHDDDVVPPGRKWESRSQCETVAAQENTARSNKYSLKVEIFRETGHNCEGERVLNLSGILTKVERQQIDAAFSS